MLGKIKSVDILENLPTLIDEVQTKGETFILRKAKKEVGVLLSIEDFRLLTVPERLKKLRELPPGELETMEILSNVEQAEVILASVKEADAGKEISLESVLED